MLVTTFRAAWTPARRFIFVALLALAWLPAAAHAGTYSVIVCDAAGVNHAFQPYGDGAFVPADPSCRPQFTGTGYQSGGVRVRNSVNAPGVTTRAPLYTSGGLRAQAPAGTVITRLRGSATSYDDMGASSLDGWRAGINDDFTSLWCGFKTPCVWGGPPMLGFDLWPTAGATRIDLAVTCAVWTGCLRDRVRARLDVDNAIIEIDDQAAPQLDASGNAWSGSWNSAAITAAMRATDGPGIRQTWFRIDGGSAVGAQSFTCDATLMAPCPADTGTVTAQLSLATLADGHHIVSLHAQDAGLNESRTDLGLDVDNSAPVVSAVELLTPAGWRRDNRFELRATASDPAGGSGIARMTWELCREDGSSCRTGSTTDGADRFRLTVPAPGSWKARFWARDALRDGGKSEWSPPIKFDDSVPGEATVTAPAWTRDTEPQVAVAMAPAAAVGPSGIAGFAVAADRQPAQVVTHPGTTATVALGPLPEGTTTVRARAIGGSGVPAATVGEAQVRVDRTGPVLDITRDPDGAETAWIGAATRIAVHARDALSGMGAAPEGSAADLGGRVSYAVDGGAATVVAGADAAIAISETGDHSIVVRAFDLAGNAGPERVLRVRVDRTAPRGELLVLDPLRPRRMGAAVDEICIDTARLQLRQRGDGGAWRSYEAAVEGHHVWADVPDDALAAGAYEVRFRITDCAGNVGTIDRFATQSAAGSSAVVRLPLRAAVTLGLAFAGRGFAGETTRITVPAGQAVTIDGSLTNADGDPLAQHRLVVDQRIGSGEWATLNERITDTTGGVHLRLPDGPSRSLRLVSQADEQTLPAISRALSVAVPARATIRVQKRRLRNGQAAVFSGRVLGGYLPANGRELELQGYNPLRGRWQPVRTSGLRSTASGAWRASYRFTATAGTVRYRFRLRVPPRPDHPFADGYSRAVTVTVVGPRRVAVQAPRVVPQIVHRRG